MHVRYMHVCVRAYMHACVCACVHDVYVCVHECVCNVCFYMCAYKQCVPRE